MNSQLYPLASHKILTRTTVDVPLVLCNRNVRKMYDNSSYFSKPILSSLALYPEALVKPSSAAFPNSTTNVHSKDTRNVNESTYKPVTMT